MTGARDTSSKFREKHTQNHCTWKVVLKSLAHLGPWNKTEMKMNAVKTAVIDITVAEMAKNSTIQK